MKLFSRARMGVLAALVVCLTSGWTGAQPIASKDTSVNGWLMHVHDASRYRAYTGTFVVSAGGSMASAKIWHACEGDQQIERVESLSGTPRSTFRRNDRVITFFPESRIAVAETRDSLGIFPGILKANESAINDYYQLKRLGLERIAGFEAELVQLTPNDNLRYGYRVWSEKRTGLVMQLQTLDLDGRVLEQAAFSELRLDATVSVGKLHQMMGNTEGYRVERLELQKVNPEARGWVVQKVVSGFRPMGCYGRTGPPAAGISARNEGVIQWIFSDGLATVSLFVEAFDGKRHGREGYTDMGGSTHTLTRRIDDWWATVVGEVPVSTLMTFAMSLERKK